MARVFFQEYKGDIVLMINGKLISNVENIPGYDALVNSIIDKAVDAISQHNEEVKARPKPRSLFARLFGQKN